MAKRRGGKTRSGAPTKLTDSLIKEITRIISRGNYRSVACRAVGIHESTFKRWMVNGEEVAKRRKEAGDEEVQITDNERLFERFYWEILASETKAEIACVNALTTHAREDWRAAAAYLRMKAPERWSENRNEEKIQVESIELKLTGIPDFEDEVENDGNE